MWCLMSFPFLSRISTLLATLQLLQQILALLTIYLLLIFTTFAQASKEVHWRLAMAKKLDVLAQNNTWTLVPTSEAQNVVDCKWVFKTKRNFGVTVERFNARLVAKGYTQEEGLNFTDTFSLVIKPTTIHLILSLAVTNN
jgi:Reverse transcriptase (RNA-dependent DNA polymerase)